MGDEQKKKDPEQDPKQDPKLKPKPQPDSGNEPPGPH